MTNALFNFLSDKYASGEASLDNFEAYLSFCEAMILKGIVSRDGVSTEAFGV
jgi:hypothetical protein